MTNKYSIRGFEKSFGATEGGHPQHRIERDSMDFRERTIFVLWREVRDVVICIFLCTATWTFYF